MFAFRRVKVLPIHGYRTARIGEHNIVHSLDLRASHTVFGSPVDAVTDQAVAAAWETSIAVNTEGDPKLIFAQTHHQRGLSQGRQMPGRSCGFNRDADKSG